MRLRRYLASLSSPGWVAVFLWIAAAELLLGTLCGGSRWPIALGQIFLHPLGLPLLGFLGGLSLLAYLIVRWPWNGNQAGLLLLHGGLLGFLLALGVTHERSREGVIDLMEGRETREALSSSLWELVGTRQDDSERTKATLPLKGIIPGDTFDLGLAGPVLVVLEFLKNGHPGPGNHLVPVSGQGAPEEPKPALILQRLDRKDTFSLAPGIPWRGDSAQRIFLRRQQMPLPFSIQLLGIAPDVSLQITENGVPHPVILTAIQPIQIESHRLYLQKVWEDSLGRRYCQLRVVSSPGSAIAPLLLLVGALGLGIHLWTHRPKSRSYYTGLLLAFCACLPAHGAETVRVHWDSPLKYPIQMDGRVKPVEVYARELLREASGMDPISGVDGKGQKVRLFAEEWFLDLLLGRPQDSIPVFLVENPQTRDALGLEAPARSRYAWWQIQLRASLLGSLQRQILALPVASRNPWQNDLLRLADAWERSQAVRHALDSLPIGVFPGDAKAALLWRQIRVAWLQGDSLSFRKASLTLGQEIATRAIHQGVRPLAVDAERWLDRSALFFWIGLSYAFGLLLAILGIALPKNRGLLRWAWRWCGFTVLVHIAGLGLRSYIAARPPVANLYESLLFVGAFSVIALLISGRKQPGIALWTNGSGLIMLGIAQKFSSEGASMPALSTLLNSQFWLTSHVLLISLGYAGVWASGIYAHFLLWDLRRGNQGPEALSGPTTSLSEASPRIKRRFYRLRILLGSGLFGVAVGTLLGSLWAERAWGRYWGWDPKENGALLILLLGLSWFHAWRANWIGPRGFSLGCIVSLQSVLFAWFAANQLGPSLHRYGQIQGIWPGLGLFLAIEIIFGVWACRGRKANPGHPPEP
ncbi:MAG TPA: cytochrome c biogenesis protein CcsA [Fibrobacteraceae bacterium]|nr:cytochrome c biogenesis protein CcsA [Fibrobacteraceae bacterium]